MESELAGLSHSESLEARLSMSFEDAESAPTAWPIAGSAASKPADGVIDLVSRCIEAQGPLSLDVALALGLLRAHELAVRIGLATLESQYVSALRTAAHGSSRYGRLSDAFGCVGSSNEEIRIQAFRIMASLTPYEFTHGSLLGNGHHRRPRGFGDLGFDLDGGGGVQRSLQAVSVRMIADDALADGDRSVVERRAAAEASVNARLVLHEPIDGALELFAEGRGTSATEQSVQTAAASRRKREYRAGYVVDMFQAIACGKL